MKRFLAATTLSLAVFLVLAYQQALTLPFVNDDYVFLDKVRHASFLELWTSGWNFFGWWRPLSREIHFWALHGIAGLWSPAYHIASFALWLGVFVLYAALVHRLAGAKAASVATGCSAALALWGAPLVWTAGAQDLWMLLFSLAYLHAIVRGARWLSVATLLAALLSKETAAVLPAVAAAYLFLVERQPPKRVLAATALSGLVVAVWFVAHPTLQERLFGSLRVSPETAARPDLGRVARNTLLAQFNLDARIRPGRGWTDILFFGAFTGSVLSLPLLFQWRRDHDAIARPRAREDERRVVAFGLAWAALAWLVLFLPSIGWHAYYGSLGTLGFWLAAGTILARVRPLALAGIFALALLRQALAETPSTDWGTYWYQARAGRILKATYEQLRRSHPAFPSGSRLFFILVPNDIGLLGGDGPAVRVWYDDPTLEAGFISSYRTRTDPDSSRFDYFFRYESESLFVELHAGPETPAVAIRGNPRWHRDHSVLASTFMYAGNTIDAAEEYEKIFRFYPNQWKYAVFAAGSFEAAGDLARADSLYAEAAYRTRMSEADLRQRSRALVRRAAELHRHPRPIEEAR